MLFPKNNYFINKIILFSSNTRGYEIYFLRIELLLHQYSGTSYSDKHRTYSMTINHTKYLKLQEEG